MQPSRGKAAERPNAPVPRAAQFAPKADAPMRKGPEREADAAEANLPIGERRARKRNGPFRAERTVGAKCDATSDRHPCLTPPTRTYASEPILRAF